MKKSQNKNKITTFIPNSKRDSFMACVSYWVYGTEDKKNYVRQQLLLHLGHLVFYQKFKNLNELYRFFFKGKLVFHANEMFENKIKDTMSTIAFIKKNELPGTIESNVTMCALVAVFYNVNVYLKTKINEQIHAVQNTNMGNKMFRISLIFFKNSYYLMFVKLKPLNCKLMFELRVSELPGKEMIVVGDFKKTKDKELSLFCYDIVDHNPNSKKIYLVYPKDNYIFKKPIFVYAVNDKRETKCVAAVELGIDQYNPYFLSPFKVLKRIIVGFKNIEQALVYGLKLKIIK